jgi:hypothetical protein
MSCERAYPPDLARWVAAHWPTETPLPISVDLLHEALATAFQASMMTEEARPSRFRLLLTRAAALPEAGEPNRGVLRLVFDRSRPFHADELRRLAPSAPFETALIGVHEEGGALRIWGIAHSGPAWLAPTWGGRDPGSNWTFDPIIHVNGPSQIAVRRAGVLVGAIERGTLVDTTIDVFESTWLPALFARERDEVRAEHGAAQAGKANPTAVESSLVGLISQHMVRRCIQLVRGAHHGGLILVMDAAKVTGGVRLKYRFEPDEPTRRYRALLLRLLEALADASEKPSIGWRDFVTNANADLERLEQAVFEWSRVIANLAASDGAVVLDKRFDILGFGAEVSAELPSRVFRALDREGAQRRPEDLEAVGTRHRAAYRFANDHPGSLAIVVSHDGAVTFVTNRDGEIVFWEQTNQP